MDFFGTILTGAVLLALFFGLMTLIAVIGLSSVVGIEDSEDYYSFWDMLDAKDGG